MKVKEVYNLKDKFSLGQKIEVHRGKEKGDERYYNRRKTKGRIIGIYDYFIVVDNGKYRESFSYADIATGRIQIKAVRAA